MNMFILDNELVIRLSFFFGIFAAMAGWELILPRRILTASKTRRWFINISITVLNSFALRLFFPIQAVGVAAIAEKNGWGLLNILQLPQWQAVLISVVLLDLLIYFQHMYFHKIPVLWRLHMLHHVDLDVDVTTGARFHPIEILLSMIIKMTAVLLLGAPAVSVVIFEIDLNGTSVFNHSNVRMNGFDRILRKIVVTPDMHRVHHSVIPRETFSNFGFNLPWWDRFFWDLPGTA
jgi:sterol desaturase/sphingolipid hydroxylase (fatty acid hydroxylase superfamily)